LEESTIGEQYEIFVTERYFPVGKIAEKAV